MNHRKRLKGKAPDGKSLMGRVDEATHGWERTVRIAKGLMVVVVCALIALMLIRILTR